ncbi:MAG: hypothetical protein SFV54_28650 [Bryobacteraceae bacterium]|nr:hypothetical protein [Bryobacteraceae bacterium]
MRFLLSACCLSVAAACALYAQLGQVQSVYMLPMANGFDQMLANRIAQGKVFRVVTDPKLADAVFTESLGERFQEQLAELYPPETPAAQPATVAPPPPAPGAAAPASPAPAAAAPATARDAKEKEAEDEEVARLAALKAMYKPPQGSSWSRGKGTIFLVDRRSKQVLWSTFEQPGDRRPQRLDEMAARVVKKIKKDLGQQ